MKDLSTVYITFIIDRFKNQSSRATFYKNIFILIIKVDVLTKKVDMKK